MFHFLLPEEALKNLNGAQERKSSHTCLCWGISFVYETGSSTVWMEPCPRNIWRTPWCRPFWAWLMLELDAGFGCWDEMGYDSISKKWLQDNYILNHPWSTEATKTARFVCEHVCVFRQNRASCRYKSWRGITYGTIFVGFQNGKH